MDAPTIIAMGTASAALLAGLSTLVTAVVAAVRLGHVETLVDGTASEMRAELRRLNSELQRSALRAPPPNTSANTASN